MSTQITHYPVLLNEVIKALNPKASHWYVDGTLGGGGHTIELLKNKAKVLAFDQDEEAINRARNNIEAACPGAKIALYANQSINVSDYDLILVNKNFSEVDTVVSNLQGLKLSGAMLDLGIS